MLTSTENLCEDFGQLNPTLVTEFQSDLRVFSESFQRVSRDISESN
jgi:hypothetical protein